MKNHSPLGAIVARKESGDERVRYVNSSPLLDALQFVSDDEEDHCLLVVDTTSKVWVNSETPEEIWPLVSKQY